MECNYPPRNIILLVGRIIDSRLLLVRVSLGQRIYNQQEGIRRRCSVMKYNITIDEQLISNTTTKLLSNMS